MPNTPNFGAQLPEIGGSENNWGNIINNAFGAFDYAFNAGKLKVNYGGTGSDNASDARNALGLGTLSTQDASSLSVGNLTTSGPVGIAKSPSVDLDINGNVQASSGVIITGSSTVSGTSTLSGSCTVDSLTANTQLKVPSIQNFTDSSGNRVLGFGCELKLTSDITGIPSTGGYNIPWHAENYDDANMWSSGIYITLPKAGLYLATMSLNCVFTSVGNVSIYIAGAGEVFFHMFRSINGNMIITVSHVINAQSSSTLYFALANSSGADATIQATNSGNVSRVNVTCLGTW